MYYTEFDSNWDNLQTPRTYRGYACSTRIKTGKCQRNYIPLENVTASLVTHLERLFLRHEDEIEVERASVHHNDGDQQLQLQLQSQLAQIEKARQRLVFLFTNSDQMTLDEFDTRAAELQESQRAVQERLTAIEAQRAAAEQSVANMTTVQEVLPHLAEDLEQAPPHEANRWLRRIFHAVYVQDREVVRVEFGPQ